MGRAENWPDPRSRKWKIGDSSSFCRNILLASAPISHPQSFKSFGLQLCPLCEVELWSRSRCAPLTLTWPGDLTFWPRKSKFAHIVYFWIVRRYAKFGGQNLPPPVRGGGLKVPFYVFAYMQVCEWRSTNDGIILVSISKSVVSSAQWG